MRRIARRIAIVGFAALVALAPATAHAADRWFAVPQSVPNSGPAEATPATWVGAGPGGVYFATSAALLPEDGDSSIDVYRRQGASLTVATPGTTGNVGGPQAVSRDGSTVVFSSSEALVPEDQDPDLADLYATTGGVTRLVSVSDPNAPFSFLSIILPSLRVSDDGRFVAFSTYEGLAASDGDNRFDTYVWDRDTGQTALASAPDSGGSDVTLDFGGMSRNGRYVFMETSAPLTSDDTDGATDVYRYDTSSDSLALFTPGTTQSYSFAGISADGTHLFYRTAESLDPADADGGQVDVYQYANGVTTLVSTAPGAAPGANDADFQRASEHGAVVFFTTAEQLTSADVDGGHDDIYKRRADGSVALVSTGPAETLFDRSAVFSDITPDGRHAFFYTQQDLTSDDTDGGFHDAYERSGTTTTRISVGQQNDSSFDDASFAGFSDDLSRLFFASSAALTSDDGDTIDDVYDRHAGETSLVTPTPAEPCTLLPSPRCEPVWHGPAGDGTRVWYSADEDLSPLDGDGGATDVYESRLAVPPTVTTTAAPLTVERGGAAVPVDRHVTVSEPYDDVFSATVHVEGGELGFSDQGGIAGVLNAAGDTLTLSGRATDAAYQAALRSVTYRSSTAGTRVVEFSVDNGSGPGEPGRRELRVPAPPGPPGDGPVTPPVEPPATPLTLHITDSGGRVAHLRSGRRFRLPGLHFACPDAAPSGCTASAEIWRVGRDGKPLRPAAAGEVALDAGERSDALVVRIGPATLRRLRARGRLTLLAHVTLRAAGASPATRVTRFRLVARLG